MDAFDTLGLAPALDLELSTLEQRYRDLQRELHPDRFAQASVSEKRASLNQAVNVNEAYRALRDPLKRAEIMLARFGAPEKEPADPALLMQVLELREGLAEAKSQRDLARAQTLQREVKTLEDESFSALKTALQSLQAGDSSALASGARALGRLRYCRRFHDEVAHFEEELLE